jgi:hypothetical protein
MQQLNKSATPREVAAEKETDLEIAAVIAAALAAYGEPKKKIASIRLTGGGQLWASAARLGILR